MTYYSALVDTDFMGIHEITRHTTQKAAIAAVRRKMAGSTAEFGIVTISEPKWDDAFKSRIPSYVIGILTPGVHPNRKVKTGIGKGLSDTAYYYQMKKKGVSASNWPVFMVRYDGTLEKSRI